MSRWTVVATERLGSPQPDWVSIFGETAADVAALHTLDLSPVVHPLKNLSQTLERDLMRASMGTLNLEVKDPDGSIADALGPDSATLATATRYFGPWIEVIENWGVSDSATRFLGYLDEASLEYNPDTGTTSFGVFHASQLLRERKLADLSDILRPYPSNTNTVTQDFVQSTPGVLLHALNPGYAVPGTDAADESARWAAGELTWYATVQKEVDHLGTRTVTIPYKLPAIPAPTLIISGLTFYVDSIAWEDSTTLTEGAGTYETLTTYRAITITLKGAPDLTAAPVAHAVGNTVTWGLVESRRTHYLLMATVSAPAAGSDGQRYLELDTVDQLIPGDVLSITFKDSGSGVQRLTTFDVTVTDVDGERARIYVLEPISQELSTATVTKIRRNSQDPVHVDGVALAETIVAPFGLDTSRLFAAATTLPVVSWVPLDQASPALYGAHDVQSLDRAGKLRLSRRGAIDTGTLESPGAGVWEGTADALAWLGLASASLPLQQVGDLNQWPEGSNDLVPPALWVAGDLSGGLTVPPNGWRAPWRSHKVLTNQVQDADTTWDGSDILWAVSAGAGAIPSRLVHFAAQTTAPGRYVLSGGTWTFEAHVLDATLAAATTPSVTGSLPAGNRLALGMGIYANASTGHEEALQILTVDTSSSPFGLVKTSILSAGASGNLTLQQTATLWTTGDTAAGVWSLGGGLAVLTYQETISTLVYAHSVLYLVDGSGGATVSLDLPSMEIVPGSIQPLSLSGSGATRAISGWYALGIESYEGDHFAIARRLRFLYLNSDLTVLNGDLEADPSAPDDVTANFRRGEIVVDPIPDGAYLARMIRTGEGDRMVGLAGSRLFQADLEISRTVERVKIADLDAMGYLEQLGMALLATARPNPDGTVSLITRGRGEVRTRDFGGGVFGGVQDFEESATRTNLIGRPMVSQVHVTFDNPLTSASEEVVDYGTREGGMPLDLSGGSILQGPTAARALARAAVTYFGEPAPARALAWTDTTAGLLIDRDPAWWADYGVGDVIPESGGAGDAVDTWTLHRMEWDLESNIAKVELMFASAGGATVADQRYVVAGYVDDVYVELTP